MMHKQPDGTWVESPLHSWFGLSYVSYFVAPRLALESLSIEWQNRFIALMEEAQEVLGETPDYHVLRDDPMYTHVEKYDSEDESSRDYIFTAVRTDPWADYRRGDAAELIAEAKRLE